MSPLLESATGTFGGKLKARLLRLSQPLAHRPGAWVPTFSSSGVTALAGYTGAGAHTHRMTEVSQLAISWALRSRQGYPVDVWPPRNAPEDPLASWKSPTTWVTFRIDRRNGLS